MTSTKVLAIKPDPAAGAYPLTLPVELALQTGTIAELCASYNITEEQWNILRHRDDFRADVQKYIDLVRQGGLGFKLKAQLQADALLSTSWKMIHDKSDNVPANVKADLMKAVFRMAGYDQPKGPEGGGGQTNLQININMG